MSCTRTLNSPVRRSKQRPACAPYDLQTGLVAEIGTGNALVALRADIDALPIDERSGVPFSSRRAGVMHACGHDIHTSVILGAALKLKEREASLNGRVRILFQPAEENFGGAKSMVRAGALRDVRAIFGMHNEPSLPVGEFATRGGPFYANVPMKATTPSCWQASW